MKVLYSQLKHYLPDLKASPREVADVYTKIGSMLDKFFEVEYNGKKDYLLDLEVRQNRADAFGVQGLARELAAYYNIKLVIPSYPEAKINATEKISIEVKATKAVKRLMAVKLSGIKIKPSPAWLKEYLAFYDINSINNLVDLTNYVMLETAHASHAFDTDLVGNKLIWELNSGFKKLTTLNGAEVELPKDALVISDGKRPLSLSFIGGKEDAINDNSSNIIVEIGVYDGGLVRRNSRQLNIITEAGSRLEKYMDPDSAPAAFNMLLDLILEHCGGEVVSEIYDNYLQPTAEIEIDVNLDKVQQIAGMPISHEESIDYLEKLGFQILSKENLPLIKVKRPINRLDVDLPEDVYEEIIRLAGFDKVHAVSQQRPLRVEVTKDITPRQITLNKEIQDILVNRGLDEVRSWILVDSQKNARANYLDWKEIHVTNSINEEVPFLRQSIAVSLFDQASTYQKNNIPDLKLFEIGKVFGEEAKKYLEHNSLGIAFRGNSVNEVKAVIEYLIRQLKIDDISYKMSVKVPMSAHPKTCWDVFVNDKKMGILYLSNKEVEQELSVAEIDLDMLVKEVEKAEQKETTSVQEVVQKIVILDANLELPEDKSINEQVETKLKANSNIWKWEIVDKFKSGKNTKYTVRVSYMHLTDQEAKKLHLEILG